MAAFDAVADPRYSFKCTWLDPSAGFERPYVLSFYLRDGTVEIVCFSVF